MTWRSLTDAELSYAVVRNRIGLAYRDNPAAASNGDSGATKFAFEAVKMQQASTSGTTSAVNISMNAWAMFPHIHTAGTRGLGIGASTSNGASPDAPRFRLIQIVGGSYAYHVNYNYLATNTGSQSWTSIPSSALDQDSPGKATTFRQLRDNVKAWAYGKSGAPGNIGRSALKTGTYSVAGTVPAIGDVNITMVKGAFFPNTYSTFDTSGFGQASTFTGHDTNVADADQPRFGLTASLGSAPYEVHYRAWEDYADPDAYVEITDTQFTSGNDFTTALAIAMRDNINATIKGAANAPKFTRAQLTTGTASTSGSGYGYPLISLNAYSFFPMIYCSSGDGYIYAPQGAKDADQPQFRLFAQFGASYSVQHRYIAA